MNHTKSWDELRCCGRVGNSCSRFPTDNRRITLVKHSIIRHDTALSRGRENDVSINLINIEVKDKNYYKTSTNKRMLKYV